MKNIKIKIVISLAFLLLSTFSEADKPKVIDRKTSDGGLLGFDKVDRSEYEDKDGITHIDIVCKNSGLKRCPKQVAYDGSSDGGYSVGEIALMQQLMDLAVNSISSNILTGYDSQQIIVTYPNGTFKRFNFEVIWHSTDSNETNSSIEIFREEILL